MDPDNFQNNPKELMRRAKKGDVEAFGTLYSFYFTTIFRYIFFRVQNKNTAEDLTQDVFLKVYNSISQFREMAQPPIAYFFTVARNSVIDYWKKKKEVLFENPEIIADKAPFLPESALEIFEKKEASFAIYQAMARLTDEQREIITLKFINELSNKEVSALLGKSEEAIRQLQCRALKVLRQELK